LVIRTDDDDTYDPYIYSLGKLNSAATLVIFNRAGSFESFVNTTVFNADAIYFAGGDQWTYYHNWKDTPMGNMIQTRIQQGVPIGGTSAGEESLGEFVFNAEFDTTDSPQALNDPYNVNTTLGTGFFTVPFLSSVICDAHFVQRDRMGRLIVFMARLLRDDWTPNAVLGIGIDQATAVLIDENGSADVVSWYDDGCAYFLTAHDMPEECEPERPLTMKGIGTFRSCGNQTSAFDFATWMGNTDLGASYQLSSTHGVLSSTQQNGSIY